MADRYPLVVNTATQRIAELPAGDNLDLLNSDIVNVGNITISNNLDTFGNVGIGSNLNVSGNAFVSIDLEAVGNITTGGYFIGDGSQLTGVTTSPGGTTGQLQYNNAGSFDGVPGVTYSSGNLTLGPVANVKMTGGTSGQYLQTDGAGNLTFVSVSSGSGYQLQPVRVATRDTITLSGTQTIDDVALAVNDRVLVWRQGTQSENGIYVVQSGAWTRASDFSIGSATAIPGVTVAVAAGTYFKGVQFYCSNSTSFVVGTNPVTFARSDNTGLISIWTSGGSFEEAAKGSNQSGSMAIGLSANAGGTDSVAMGYSARTAATGVAIGYNSNTQTGGTALGYNSNSLTGGTSLGWNGRAVQQGVAIGYAANANGVGSTAMGNGAVAVTSSGIAIGNVANAGGGYSIAMGWEARTGNSISISIGPRAGGAAQGGSAIAIGNAAGNTSQGQQAIAIGDQAALTSQGLYSVAIGPSAGQSTQGSMSIAIGVAAGITTQGGNSIAMGRWAGRTNQGANSIALGWTAGNATQGANSIAIGQSAGSNTQGADSIAIGANAAFNVQGANSIIIGTNAASSGSGVDSVMIGKNVSVSNVLIQNVVFIGPNAGTAGTVDGTNSIAIGINAGKGALGTTNLGRDSIAIGNSTVANGAGSIAFGPQASATSANTIVLNASGSPLTGSTANALFVKPVRTVTSIPSGFSQLYYNPTTGEIVVYVP